MFMTTGENRMRALVTGCAGFVGSSLAEELLRQGNTVHGIDCFTDYYPRIIKEENIKALLEHERFVFDEKNLLDVDMKELLSEVDVIFHQAAQAGVRSSWGNHFHIYTDNNILATQRILEAMSDTDCCLVYASSSSVYGETKRLPMCEEHPTHPRSPYGVTKLAAEHLCHLYWENFGVKTIALRYFTVYGPRQRPDMAFHRFIRAMLTDKEIVIYGDGTQTRDFTFISDAVQANIQAFASNRWGGVYNIGGGTRCSINDVIQLLETILGHPARVKYLEPQKGDVMHTYADTKLARTELGFNPTTSLAEGLAREAEWIEKVILARDVI